MLNSNVCAYRKSPLAAKRPYNNVTCLAFPGPHVDMDVADS